MCRWLCCFEWWMQIAENGPNQDIYLMPIFYKWMESRAHSGLIRNLHSVGLILSDGKWGIATIVLVTVIQSDSTLFTDNGADPLFQTARVCCVKNHYTIRGCKNRERPTDMCKATSPAFFERGGGLKLVKIVAAFREMHVSPAKHSYGSVTDGRTDRRIDRRTDRQTTDKVIPLCRYASQATQKLKMFDRAAHL